jgi:hypothetical protein
MTWKFWYWPTAIRWAWCMAVGSRRPLTEEELHAKKRPEPKPSWQDRLATWIGRRMAR